MMKNFTFMSVMLLIGLTSLSAQDLIGHWNFEEGSGTTTEDLSGNLHTGTLKGAIEFSDDAIVGDYSIKMFRQNGEGVSLNSLDLGNEFSISLWAKAYTGATNIQLLFANYKGGVPGSGFAIMINEYPKTNKSILVYTGNETDHVNAITGDGVFPYDVWNHVVVVFDRTVGKAKIYVNGKDETLSDEIFTDFNVVGPCMIGAFQSDVPNWTINGHIDDVKIFNKKLNFLEIQELYEENKPLGETINLNSNDTEASENGQDEAIITFTRNNSDVELTVDYSISGSSMKDDYTPVLSGQIVFPVGSTSVSTTIIPVDDEFYEGNESLIIQLLESSVYSKGEDSIVTITIEDDEDLPDNLTAYWPLDEGQGTTVDDITGNGYDGTLNGNIGFSTDAVMGIYSIEMDRNNGEFIDVGSMDLGEQFTISMWSKIDTSASNIQVLFANYPGGTSDAGLAVYVNEYGTSDKSVRIYASADGSSYEKGASNDSVIVFGEWNHVAVSVDKTAGTAKIYVNGEDVTSDETIGTNFNSNTGINYLGAYTSGNWTIKGKIDDARIYNKKLSSLEIKEIIKANAENYGLTFEVFGQGTVTPKEGYYKVGSELSLSATPETGWEFVKWGGDVESFNSNITLTIDTAKEVIALFIEEQEIQDDTVALINFTKADENNAFDAEGWTNVYDTASFPITLDNGVTLTMISDSSKNISGGTGGEPVNRYPDNVGNTYNYWSSGTPYPIKLVISGLDPDLFYRLNCFSSREFTYDEDRPTEYTIGDVSKELNARENAVDIVTFTGISPNSSGEIILTMSNVNGTYAYVNAIEITVTDQGTSVSELSQNNIYFYPVPVDGILNIDNLKENSVINVYNISGKMILEQECYSNHATLNMKELRAGLYIVRVISTNYKESKVFKVIKR